MKAELRALHSPDVDDLKSWHPDRSDWGILVQLLVGPVRGAGEESFDVTVCHPTSLLRGAPGDPVIGRHHLFMTDYSHVRLELFLRSYVDNVQADDWAGITEKLSRLGHWEFEDFTS